VPRDLETICLAAMAKAPARRYATAGEFADDLRRWLGGEPIRARPAGRLERAWRWLRRHPARAGLWAMTALALLAVVGVAVSLAFNSRLQKAHEAAVEARQKAETAEGEARQNARALDEARRDLEKSLGETKLEQEKTRQALTLANMHAYFHRMALADAALRENNVERARALLEACPKELRRWEWRHLMQQCSAPLKSFSSEGKGGLHRVRIDPKGRFLAWSDGIGAVTVADSETGKPVWSRQAPDGQIGREGLAISPDGRLLACEGKGGTIEIRELADGTLRQTIPMGKEDGHPGSPRAGTTALAFAPNGKKLAVAWGNWIGLIDVERETYSHTYPTTLGPVFDLHFHPDSKSFVSANAGGDYHASIWGVDGGPAKRSIYCNQASVFTAQFDPRGTLLATGGLDGSIKLWNPANGELITTILTHDFTVRRIAFRPDGLCLASCSSDGTVQIHSLRLVTSAVVYRGHGGHVFDVAFHPEGDRLYSAGVDGTVKVWDATTTPGTQAAKGTARYVDFLRTRFVPNGRQIVTAGLSDAFEVRDSATLGVVRSLRPVRDIGPKEVAIHPSGTKAALRANGMALEVRDLSNGKVLLTLKDVLHYGPALYAPDGEQLLTADSDGAIAVREADTGKVIRSLSEHKAGVNALAISRDGRWLASASEDGALLLWDLPKGAVVHRLAEPEKTTARGFITLAFSADDVLLASGTTSGKIHLWNVADGRLSQTLAGHLGAVFDLKFLPDGKRLVSGGMDRRARLWDVQSGQEALTLWRAPNQVYSVDVDDKGERILACSGNQILFAFSGEEPTPAWHEARLTRQKEQLRAWQRREMELAAAVEAWHAVEWLATRLIEAKASQPTDHAFRGLARAGMGRRDEARADLAEAWKHRDCSLEIGSWLALLHHEAGDDKAHRAVVAEVLERHGDTTATELANNVAWACARFPGAVDDWKQVAKLAALAAGPEGRRSTNGLNTLGAVLYRAGDYEGAISAIEEGIDLRGDGGVIEDWVFLAMARHKLGQKSAGLWLRKAQKALEKREKARKKGEDVVPLRDLEATLLVREAVATLREKEQQSK
jgi:WD40 repeat protein